MWYFFATSYGFPNKNLQGSKQAPEISQFQVTGQHRAHWSHLLKFCTWTNLQRPRPEMASWRFEVVKYASAEVSTQRWRRPSSHAATVHWKWPLKAILHGFCCFFGSKFFMLSKNLVILGRSLAWSPGRSTWVSGKKITSDAKTELRWREKWRAVAACSIENTANPGVMGMILREWNSVCRNSFWRSTKVSSPARRPLLWSFQKKKRFLDLWKSTKGMKNPAVGKFNCPRNYVTPRLRALLVACATHCRSALAELLWRHHTWQTVQLKENVNVYDQLPSNYLLSFWN